MALRVMITGCAGMLGSAVYPAFVEAGHDVEASDLLPRDVAGRPMRTLDVRDASAVEQAVAEGRPDLILHLAAETDLEVCEQDPDEAYRTNTIGTQNVALAARRHAASLVYISTAGVFDGTKRDGPYTEFDAPNPINVYGDSKFQGERIIERMAGQTFIVRAGWMVGGGDRDHKFIAKILDQLRAGQRTIYAVTDKLGTPTYTADFANNLLTLVASEAYGLYHMACHGDGSRYDVAREMLRLLGRTDVEVIGVPSEHFRDSYPAPRPRSEMMRNLMLELRGINQMRPWQEALADYLVELALIEPADPRTSA